MLEKLKDLIKRVFSQKGIDEGTTEEVLVELEKGEEEPQPQEQDLPPVEEPAPLEPVVEEEPKPEEGEALAVEGEPVQEELPPEPVEEAPVAPAFDFQKYDDKIDELQKTNEALLARIGSLEEALKASGIIEGSKPAPVGVDSPTAPAKDATDDGLDAFLARVNKKRI